MNFNITQSQVDQRIDNFLIKSLKGVPKSCIYRLLRKGSIRVNRKRAKSDYRIQLNDIITTPDLRLAQNQKAIPGSRVQQLLEKSILFEDDDILVINKPSGVASHGGSGNDFGAIEIMRQSRGASQTLELIHRLDKETSGCLMMAKNRPIMQHLQQAFKLNQVEKTYWLLVYGHWPKRLSLVDFPLDKNQFSSGEYITKTVESGKRAVTRFNVLQYFTDWTLLEAKPETGRTHQIRVHAAMSGYPIAGDKKYADKKSRFAAQQAGIPRLFLHAHTLTINLSTPKKEYHFNANLDQKLNGLLQQLDKPKYGD